MIISVFFVNFVFSVFFLLSFWIGPILFSFYDSIKCSLHVKMRIRALYKTRNQPYISSYVYFYIYSY